MPFTSVLLKTTLVERLRNAAGDGADAGVDGADFSVVLMLFWMMLRLVGY